MSPRARVFAGAFLLLASKALVGCGFDCDCPPPQTYRVTSGAWTAASDASVTTSDPDAGAPLPHGAEPTTMVVDRDAGVVTLTRRLARGTVVERWRIRASEIH